MPRINLSVPYSEKDAAKRLGARWDTMEKVWYIPHGVSPAGFEKWLPTDSHANDYEIVSDSYIMMHSHTACWSCGLSTGVYGIVLPPMHKVRRSDAGFSGDQSHMVEEPDLPGIVTYISRLTPSVAARLKKMSPHYAPEHSKATEASYWMNHCKHCGQKQGDFHLHEEPGGAFDLMDQESAENIRLDHVTEPFACDGAAGYVLYENRLWEKFIRERGKQTAGAK